MQIIKKSVSKRTRKNKRNVYVARLVWIDQTGRSRETTKIASIRTEAKDYLRDMVMKFERSHGAEIDAGKMVFSDLLAYFTKNYAQKAVISDGRKVSGYRDLRTIIMRMKQIKAHFPNKKIQQIRYDDLRNYKIKRASELSESTKKQLSIASVNRELALLKRIFNIARQNGWIFTNPFVHGQSLIDISGEKRRERIITSAEEQRLLEACETPERIHLKPFLIALLDTGARAGEMLRLNWNDIDFINKTITFVAENTKTLTQRKVGITQRLEVELLNLYESSTSESVFPFKYEHHFRTARSIAGLEDVRVHDLRHTAATRLIRQGVSISEVGRILGHTTPATTFRYINVDSITLNKATHALETYSEIEIVTEANN